MRAGNIGKRAVVVSYFAEVDDRADPFVFVIVIVGQLPVCLDVSTTLIWPREPHGGIHPEEVDAVLGCIDICRVLDLSRKTVCPAERIACARAGAAILIGLKSVLSYRYLSSNASELRTKQTKSMQAAQEAKEELVADEVLPKDTEKACRGGQLASAYQGFRFSEQRKQRELFPDPIPVVQLNRSTRLEWLVEQLA